MDIISQNHTGCQVAIFVIPLLHSFKRFWWGSLKTEKRRADSLFDPYFWKKIAKALLVNALTVTTLIMLFFLSGLVDEPFSKVTNAFQESYPHFFWPLNRFLDFFGDNAATPAIAEELSYRGPIRVLVGLIVFFRKELNWWFMSFVWSAGLVLNYQWATTIHTAHELMWIPVFIAGVTWLWLVIRTNRLWPSMFCHTAANLSIYLVIKVNQLLL